MATNASIIIHIQNNLPVCAVNFVDITTKIPAESKKALIKLDKFDMNAWFPVIASPQTLRILQGDAVTINITLPVGNYGANEIVSSLNTLLNAAGGYATYVVSFSTVTGLFTIDCGVGHTIQIIGANSSLLPFIGFTANTSTGVARSLTGTLIVDLGGFPNIFVSCNWLSPNTYFNSSDRAILAKVPVDVPLGSRLYYRGSDDDWIEIHQITNTLSIYLLDNNLSTLPTQNFTWNATIKIIFL